MNEDLPDALGRALRESLESAASEEVHADPLLAPFVGEELDRLVDGALDRLDAGDSLEPRSALDALDTLDPSEREREVIESGAGAEVIGFSARRGRLGAALAVVAAAAAVVAISWLGLRDPSASGERVAALPSYSTTTLRGGLAAQRGAEPQEPERAIELHRDGHIDWVLTPNEPAREALAVALLAIPESGTTAAVYRPDVGVEISPAGAVRLRGELSAFIELEPGRWSLSMLIAAAGALPRDAPAAKSPGDWQRATIDVTIVGP